MSDLTRWDPFREMLTLRSAMDRWMDNALSGVSTNVSTEWAGNTWSVALDVNETADEYIVKASLPGLKPEDLDVTFNNGVLTLKGELKEEQESKEARWHLRERRYGTFTRSIQLPTSINGEAIQASYDAGVLTLVLPKLEEAKPRKIQITHGENKMIEAKASDIKTRN